VVAQFLSKRHGTQRPAPVWRQRGIPTGAKVVVKYTVVKYTTAFCF